MEVKLNKISTRYYWDHFLAQEDISSSLFCPVQLNSCEQLDLFQKYVCIVNIETSAYCNRKCSYCPVSLDDSRKSQSYMDGQVFEKIISELEMINYSSTIVFNLYNEPLADKNIYHRVAQARKSLPNSFLMFNSNGDYVNTDKLNKLRESGLNALFITLHPSVKKNYELNDRIKYFHKLFGKLGITQGEIEEPLKNGNIESNIDWYGMRLRIMANDWSKYGNSRAGMVSFLNAQTVRTSPCVRPLREFTISHDGSVFPCCQFYPDVDINKQYIIGNVASKSIFEIYASQTLAKWRTDLFTFSEKKKPCDSCRDEDFSKQESAELRQTLISKLTTQEI